MKKVITILLILSMLTIPCNAKLYAENSNKTLVKMEISHIQGDKNINNEVSPVGTDSLESMPEDNEDVLPIDIEAMEHTMIEPIKITVNQAVYMDDILYGNSVYYNVLKKAGKQDILKNIDVKNVPPYKAETDNKVQESQPEEPINNNDSTENEVINQTLINNSEEDSIEQTKDDTDLKAEISLEISNNDDRASNLDNNYDKASVTDAVYDENKENSAYTESETTFEQKESDLLGINSELMQTMSTTSSNKAYYNTLVGPSAMNNVHNEKYSTWSEMGEIISPETGDLTYQETDLKLPGRNGLDLDIGRIYQSNQALWGDRKCSADLNIGYTDYSTYYLNRYALGLGWSFKFPSVQVEKDEGQTELYYHTGAGPVYHVEFTADTSDSNLEDYDKKDAVFDNETSYSNGQVSSQYVFKTADQTKQYFAADGRLLAIADRFNNRILFQHIERPVTNYAPNYSFYYPENKGIWTTNSYYSYDQNIGMESSSSGKSLKFSSVASVTVSSMSKYIEVLPNTKYYLGGYINDQLTQGNCSLAYREYNNNYVETQGSAYAPASKNSWQLCEGYFTTGSSAKYIRIEFKNQTAIGSSWFDTVRFDRAWPLISNINDSIGRNISFTYTDNLYAINPSSGQIHITVNDPANTSNFSFDYTRGLYYCDHNYFTNGVSQWSEERRYPCLSNFNDGNRYHGYSYFIDQDPMEKFSFISKNLNGDYAYAPRSLLSGVYLTRSAIHYDWQKTTKHLGASGAYETYRVNNRYEQNLFTGGYQGTNYHRQYTYSGNYNGTDYDNETGYPGSYSLGDNANFLFTSTLQQDNNLIVKQTFKGGKEYKTETINSDGQKDILYNEVYDTAFKKQPTKVKNEKISASGTATYYVGYTYNDWGGLAAGTRPLTPSQWDDTTVKNQNTTHYTYDPTYKFLTAKTYYQNPDRQLTETINYDSSGRIQSTVNAKGEMANYFYEDSQNPENLTKQTITLDPNHTSTIAYDYAYNNSISCWPTRITQSYTENGAAKSSTTTIGYDYLRGNMISTKDALNNSTTHAYDNYGRITRTTYPKSTGKDGAYVLQENYQYGYAYQSELNGQKIMRVRHYLTKNSSSIIFDYYSYYDEHGNLLLEREWNSANNTWLSTLYGINPYGQLASLKDPNGNITSYATDPWNHLKTITDAQNNRQEYEYDICNHTATSYFLPNGGSRENDYKEQYDQWGHCVSRKGYPNGFNGQKVIEEIREYDIAGNCTKVIDPKNNETQYKYDALNRLVQITNALGEKTDYDYDRLGGIKTQKQYQGATELTTSKSYDERGLLTAKQEPLGPIYTYQYQYNAQGLPAQIIDPNGKTYTYDYYSDSKLKTIHAGGSTITCAYHPLGGVERYTAAGTGEGMDYSYYSTGLVKERKVSTFPVQFGYDNNGNLTDVTDPFNQTIHYQPDSLNRTTSITAGNKSFAYEYNGDGAIKTITYPNGALKTEYTYDNMNRLKTITNKKGTNQLQNAFSYDYDDNGNIERITDLVNLTSNTYEYDALNRLQTVIRADGKRISYRYDSRGNRLQLSANAIDLQNLKQGAFTYNDWDEMASFTPSGAAAYAYTYDPEGIRTSKQDTATNGAYTRYHCDDSGRVIAESNGNNQVTAQIIWGVDKPLARKIGNAYYYYVYNGHGDVIALTDENGTVKNTYSYDEWGNITSISETSGLEQPIRYCGEYYDTESGLYYLRARYYDPMTGRFISKDSLEGQIDNPLSLNLYTYCYSNPLRFIDPSGNIVTDWDYDHLTADEIKKIEQYTREYIAGNTYAHEKAEAIRNKYRKSTEYGTS